MSDYVELWERFDRYGAERFETFKAWALSADLPGRLGAYYADRAAGSWWENAFRTFKAVRARGVPFMAMTLAFPEVTKLRELFDAARYVPNPPGGLYQAERNAFKAAGAAGFLFVSGRSIGGAPNPAPCGDVGGSRSWSDGTGVRRHMGGTFHCTYARPLPAVLADWGIVTGPDADGFELASFELVTHDTGRTLVIGRNRYGSRWLAYLDAGETFESLMPQGDRDIIAKERARDLAAWGGFRLKPERGQVLYVDGAPRHVKGEGRELHGFLDLHVGDADSDLVHSVHAVPLSWWKSPDDRSAVRTGGHLYAKES